MSREIKMWSARVNWDKVWNDFEEWVSQDLTEGKKATIQEHREYVQMLVERQLRKNPK